MLVAAGTIAALIGLLFATAAFWVNWWWYGSMGYRGVLTARYSAEIVSFVVGFLVAAAIFGGNVVFALRRSRHRSPSVRLATLADRALLISVVVSTVAVAFAGGVAAAKHWQTWQLWLHGDAFGVRDPVFGRDVGFYVFALPALHEVAAILFGLLLATVVVVAVVYVVRLGVGVRDIRRVPGPMRVHLFALGGAVLLVVAARDVLANYDLVYSERGVVFGASYTDVHVQRFANWTLAVLTLAIAGLLLVNAFVRRVRLLVGIVAAWAVASVVLGILLPAAVQQTIVEPSELKRERPYIANNLAMTRAAFDLDPIETRELTGQAPLTAADLTAFPQTLSNIRLWDYRIIRTTYQQLQSFVPYYLFNDVDVDRYPVDGSIQQVVLSARELDQHGLPSTAQTWTNRHLVYTHGYGAVVSPVGEVSTQGLPRFVVERIPPTGVGVYAIERPEIYFGEVGEDWVAVDTDQPEFAGTIDGDASASSSYRYTGEGRGSVRLDSYLKKLLVAVDLGDRNVLFSSAITDDSRILLHRDVVDRVHRLAPFLLLDDDPYLVIADGRLVWIIDAYTHSDRFPHASRSRGVNYLRNSVKVVVDAYDGTTTFYRTAEPDPLADAYGEIFGGLFRPIADAPPAIAAHFRYPELLFDVQSDVYATVHVTDPTAYYNGEDRWAIPREQVDGAPARMEPYFVTMTLPGENTPEFVLIRPFTPGGNTDRQNMTAWMAGRTDAKGNLSLVLYRFPRQETVFGPAQIEARIDQEPEISAQISLWNQSGSQVIRGNLLVIPIGESILYVQPLYLKATGTQGALPELKRVIVASNERVVMRERLAEALAALVAGSGPVAEPAANATQTPASNAGGELAQKALDAYRRGKEALSRGDWAGYGEAQAELERLLEAMTGGEAGRSGSPATPAAATPIAPGTPVPGT
jgi:uncharacterized protein